MVRIDQISYFYEVYEGGKKEMLKGWGKRRGGRQERGNNKMKEEREGEGEK